VEEKLLEWEEGLLEVEKGLTKVEDWPIEVQEVIKVGLVHPPHTHTNICWFFTIFKLVQLIYKL
jgi:hypothetical protein